ncbi:LamG-like jellyroll fold domain-containing protein [Saliterribacillus persicus]|uniref:Arabinan endo-1,5-alpha-L-arabinosidase n=1 Tax=Saliterribacillus persicus TaxID=930114 RepID=A0A368XCH6_9BACI|nr:LamG-like jellyroll fold domain-containing protein [Saliterribacillus persicus]RCW63734.1 arabinan endo-1,5-alpha-L-arabinosidase [Saliterribacillus persicus]
MFKDKIGLIIIFSSIVVIALAIVIFFDGENETQKDNKEYTDRPSFTNVSVHDPSLIKDKDTYYIFGTHIEAAKSTDLMNWERFTNGYQTTDNALYGNLSENLAESFEWAGEDDADSSGGFAVWAPDIFWNENYINEDGSEGAYMIYYSASSTYIRSAIGYAVSKDIEGPYEYVDTVVYSGFTEGEAFDNNSEVNKQWENTHIDELIEADRVSGPNGDWFNNDGSYNNMTYPNAIDANLFYDKEGKLWMNYGSWSGGIFLLELDEETGQPIYPNQDGETEDGRIIDRYFGKKISGGYGKSGEGPYIVYDEATDYYYLYVTYGWLGADGEYNMRTFRSDNAEGPYVDAAGQPAVLPNNTDNAPYGNKLMGHFLFEKQIGDSGTGNGFGYMSPGHNSVFYEEDNDKKFLAFHTRFPDQGETFESRIHPFYMNDNDWPVVAPYPYTGEKLEEKTEEDIIGDYKYMNHEKDNTNNLKYSSFISLKEDGSVTGAVEGSWELFEDYRIKVKVKDTIYDGVLVTQWDPMEQAYVTVFTAMSDKGVTIWGSKLLEESDEAIADAVENELSLPRTDGISKDLNLKTTGAHNSNITWKSSDENALSNDGKVNLTDQEQSVTLTATISKGEVTKEKTFQVTLSERPDEIAEVEEVVEKEILHFSFNGSLEENENKITEPEVTGNRLDNEGGEVDYSDGVDGEALLLNGESGLRFTDGLIQTEDYSVSLWLNPTSLSLHTTTFFGAKDEENWVSLVPMGAASDQTMIWSGSETWYDAPTGKTIPTDEWSHLAFTVSGETIKVYLNGEETFTGDEFPQIFKEANAAFGLGVNYWDTPYEGLVDELMIYNYAISQDEIEELGN